MKCDICGKEFNENIEGIKVKDNKDDNVANYCSRKCLYKADAII